MLNCYWANVVLVSTLSLWAAELLLVLLHTEYPMVASEELLTAADGLKLIEPDNQLILIVDALSLATESKSLTVAKEKTISG